MLIFVETFGDVLCSGCRDLDECTEGEKKCGKNTDCINTDGGHHCVCQIGFGGDPCKFFWTYSNQPPCFLRLISSPPDSECKDIDECQHFNGSPVDFTYSHPTFRNLPGDEWILNSYAPQPCDAEETCINIFYKDGLGFRCVPRNQTFAAVAIGGLTWNSEVDVLKADLNRCDGMIPTTWYSKNSWGHKVIKLL